MQFGNYILLKKLGTGGMAEVFLAKQCGLAGFERLVCIKRILPHLAEHTEFITMFQDEARIAANLNHPNIVQIYELGEIESSYFIAMELIKGEDVRQIYNAEVARGRIIPYVNAAQIIYGACNGLGFAHASCDAMGNPLGLVHRDISPQNILVTYNGYPKIVDFGVAKARGKMTETRAGVLKGKYSYMSPEQAKGKQIDGRSDVFATGIVLYEITTGQRLFKRENEIETLHAVMNCRITPPSKLVPGYPPELEEIVMHSLAANVNDRYATAYDFANDLEKFILNNGGSTSPQALATYMQELFADKLKDDPYSPAKLEEMAQQASSISLVGYKPQAAKVNSADGEKTVAGGKGKRRGRTVERTTTRVIQDNGHEVIIEEENIYDPRTKAILWGGAVAMVMVASFVLYLAFGTLKNPNKNELANLPSQEQAVETFRADSEMREKQFYVDQERREAAAAQVQNDPEEKAVAIPPATAPVVAAPPVKAAEVAKGYLTVNAAKSWQVFVGKQYKGTAPLNELALPPGNYKLRFHISDVGVNQVAKVEIKAGKETVFNIPSGSGSMNVNADPWAQVKIGNKALVDTPTVFRDLPVGDYQVQAVCENGKHLNQNVKVKANTPSRVKFNCN